VAGITQTTQATLLLKKKKEMREVDDALNFMKEEYKARMAACEARQVRAAVCLRDPGAVCSADRVWRLGCEVLV
jgi:hypothetical protein